VCELRCSGYGSAKSTYGGTYGIANTKSNKPPCPCWPLLRWRAPRLMPETTAAWGRRSRNMIDLHCHLLPRR
jgi:hypothetical protein